jgi:hypothetical protein
MMKVLLVILFFSICKSFFAQDITKTVLNKINASEYKLDVNNEDGVFVAKNKKTNKWGMYQAWSEKEINEMIPPKYDSIDFFGFNSKLTGVWYQGKVGIYQSPWSYGEEDAKQTVDCLYDDYKIFNVERTIVDGIGRYRKYFDYVAVKNDGLWAWIDWMTGELKSEFIYDLEKEKMPYPDFEQKN